MNRETLTALIDKPVVVDTRTPVKLMGGKKNPQQGRIFKITTFEGVLMSPEYYQSKIDHEAHPRKWGKRAPDQLIEHNGNVYAMFNVENVRDVIYIYRNDDDVDVVIDKEEIIGLPAPRKNNSPIKVATYNIDNIISINPK